MRIWGVNFRGPAALNKAATRALNKDKAFRGLQGKATGLYFFPTVLSQDTQPPLTPRQGLDYRGRMPDASP